jgi:hypothetical protein
MQVSAPARHKPWNVLYVEKLFELGKFPALGNPSLGGRVLQQRNKLETEVNVSLFHSLPCKKEFR